MINLKEVRIHKKMEVDILIDSITDCLLNTRTGKDRMAVIEITIETKNLEELNTIFKAVRKIDSVYEVKRKKV